ncbi:hypothetical protein MRX96_017630 [Rhipicephalus microplus]
MKNDGDPCHDGAGGKRHKSSLSKSSHRHHPGRRASIVAEPEVRVITPVNKSTIDAAQRAETHSRRQSSSLGSLSEGSGGESRRASAASERETRPSKRPSVGEATSPNQTAKASAASHQAHSLRRSAHHSVGDKRRRSASKTSSSSSSSPKKDKHEGAKEGTAVAKTHVEKDATKASGPSGRTRRAWTTPVTRPSTATEGVHGAAVGHAERNSSVHDAGRPKVSSDKNVSGKAHGEKGAANSKTGSSSGRHRQASTAFIGAPAVASHLTPAATPPQDQARFATGPHLTKVTGTTSNHASSKEHRHSSSKLHGGSAPNEHLAVNAPLKQSTTGPNSAPDSHKGYATSSAVSNGPATTAAMHVQDYADVPRAVKAASMAHVPPDSKPFDAAVSGPTTASYNGPPVGIIVPAVIQQLLAPGSSHDVKVPDSAHSKDNLPAGLSATSNQEGNKVENRYGGDREGGFAARQATSWTSKSTSTGLGSNSSCNRPETKPCHHKEEKKRQHGEPYWT